MKKYFLLLLIFIACLFPANGQDKKDTISNANTTLLRKNYFGINIGTTTGVGFSYMYMPKKNGVQITLIPLIDKSNVYYSVGATYLRSIESFSTTNFVIFCGNHLTNFFADNSKVIYSIGIGPGIIRYEGAVAFKLMIGYGCYDITNDIKTRPTFEFGVYYNY